MASTAPNVKSKPHYEILDGLRGVAAMMVVIFHCLEAYSQSDPFKQIINHGYMAVDFFFLLSGFVVAYAYDDRWGRMPTWDFYKRRLIRLQPMVVMGAVIGAIFFYFQKGPAFPHIAGTPVWKLLLVMGIGMTLIPVPTSLDIRGWGEMHPLDGPAWSLFYEYVANVLYAVVLRRLSQIWLGVLTALTAVFLVHLLVTGPRGDVVGGWSLTPAELHVGFARLLFPFVAGMLLMRSGKRIRVPGGFFWCSVLLVVTFSLPRFGGPAHLWVNGLYEALCIIVVYPVIVAIGAGSVMRDGAEVRVCRFLGNISYPLYITHYALIYTYWTWVVRNNFPMPSGLLWGAVLFVSAVLIAYACLKLYDEPVRAWLSARFLPKNELKQPVNEVVAAR